MTPAQHQQVLEIATALRTDLGLRQSSPAVAHIEGWMITCWAVGFREGWWDRDEHNKRQRGELPPFE